LSSPVKGLNTTGETVWEGRWLVLARSITRIIERNK
jgi:hypothetical protein